MKFKDLIAKFFLYDKKFKVIKGSLDNVKQDKTVLFVVDSGWNTIEYTIPCLYYLKKHHPYLNIVIFMPEVSIWLKYKEEQKIAKLMEDISSCIIVNTSVKDNWFKYKIWRLRKSVLERKTIEYFLKDAKFSVVLRTDLLTKTVQCIYQYHPHAKHIVQPHGAFLGVVCPENLEKKSLGPGDFWVMPDETWPNYFEGGIDNSVLTGAPQLDSWWIETVYKDELQLFVHKLNSSKKNILVLLPLLQDDFRISKADQIVLFKVLNSYKGHLNFIFKFHPRELYKDRKIFLEKYGFSEYRDDMFIVDLPTEVVSAVADCVICAGESSALANALINDVPVIEFYTTLLLPCYYKISKDKYVSALVKNGVVMYADTYDSLMLSINSVICGSGWKKFSNKYKKYIVSDGMASCRMADVVLKALQINN